MCNIQECRQCSATVLETTFQRTDGLCKPCWREQRRINIGKTRFGKTYDDYFHQPGRVGERYFDCWKSLELDIAGSLWEARNSGDFSYVFRQQIFDEVNNFDDLIAWTMKRINRFRNEVCEIYLRTNGDTDSRDNLLSKASELEKLIELWIELEREDNPKNVRNS